MTFERKPRLFDLVGICAAIMLIGWVVSVGIRSWRGTPFELVGEMTGAAVAVSVLYSRMKGRPGGPGGET